jgi:hypothetical protein
MHAFGCFLRSLAFGKVFAANRSIPFTVLDLKNLHLKMAYFRLHVLSRN